MTSMEMETITAETSTCKTVSLSSESTLVEATTPELKASCKASWLNNGSFLDVLPLRFVKLKLLDSVNFRNGGSTDSSSSLDQTEDDDMHSGGQTPTTSIFDPFAPGPDDVLLAPKKKKLRDSYLPPMRQLDFDAKNDCKHTLQAVAVKGEEEEQILDSIFASLLELIISTQLAEASDENLVSDSEPIEACMTPKSLPLLSHVAETCPPAPTRPKLSLDRSSQSTCRKLDFGSSLN